MKTAPKLTEFLVRETSPKGGMNPKSETRRVATLGREDGSNKYLKAFRLMAVEGSKPHDREAGDRVKVTNVAGRYAITKLQRGHSDQEISERKPHSSGLIRSIDLSGTQSYCRRDRMNWQRR